MTTGLLTRPFSSDRPKVDGFTPLIRAKIERVGRRKHNSWRAQALVNDCPMSTSHHDTKASAELWAEGAIKVYAEVHYIEV